jgi:uncharacterized protein YraI
MYNRILAAEAAALMLGCLGVSYAGEARVGEASAAFQNLRNVRSGPGFEFPIVYQVPFGTAQNVICFTNDSAGNTWLQLADGNYMLASIVGGGGYPACTGVGISGP